LARQVDSNVVKNNKLELQNKVLSSRATALKQSLLFTISSTGKSEPKFIRNKKYLQEKGAR
jgi:hypothetical protein